MVGTVGLEAIFISVPQLITSFNCLYYNIDIYLCKAFLSFYIKKEARRPQFALISSICKSL